MLQDRNLLLYLLDRHLPPHLTSRFDLAVDLVSLELDRRLEPGDPLIDGAEDFLSRERQLQSLDHGALLDDDDGIVCGVWEDGKICVTAVRRRTQNLRPLEL